MEGVPAEKAIAELIAVKKKHNETMTQLKLETTETMEILGKQRANELSQTVVRTLKPACTAGLLDTVYGRAIERRASELGYETYQAQAVDIGSYSGTLDYSVCIRIPQK